MERVCLSGKLQTYSPEWKNAWVKQVAYYWPSVILSQGKWLIFQLTPSEAATDEWVAQSGMKVNLPWHVLCKAIFLSRERVKATKNLRAERTGDYQGISNAWVKKQWSHFKSIEILWSDCGEDLAVIRPVGREITANGSVQNSSSLEWEE